MRLFKAAIIVLGLYFKALQRRNLRKMDRFLGKLVTFGFDKTTCFNKQTH